MTTNLQRERNALVRAALTAFIDNNRQVSLADLCREFQLHETEARNHLRALRDQSIAHRAVPMKSRDTDVGQIWAIGPQKVYGNAADPEPIQVTIHHWKPERVAPGLLESLFFAQGVPA